MTEKIISLLERKKSRAEKKRSSLKERKRGLLLKRSNLKDIEGREKGRIEQIENEIKKIERQITIYQARSSLIKEILRAEDFF